MNQQEITDYQYFLASPFFAELEDFNTPDAKIFIKSFCELPLSLRGFLTSPDTASVIISLGEKYRLQEKQITSTSKLIKDLILGKIFIRDLPANVSSNLEINETKSSQLINDLVSQSFGPIIEDIKRIQRAKFPDRVMAMQRENRSNPQQTEPTRPQKPVQSQPLQRPPYLHPPVIRPIIPPQPQNQPPAPSEARLEGRPPTLEARITPKERQFKVPDLSQPQPPSSQAKESLENELEKVANIIDLRNKPRE